jgi:L-ribulose-5-phosphate 3-epimerase
MPRAIGVMQGRLSPPVKGRIQAFPGDLWRSEFVKGARIGIAHIEWIYERDECDTNPISTPEGRAAIRQAIAETNVCVVSVCADYFMDVPYLSAAKETQKSLRERLVWLVDAAHDIGARFIDIPFVDASRITSSEQYPAIREFVLPAAEAAAPVGMTIALETNLGPRDFRELLLYLDCPQIMANYDTGNSSGIGYDCTEELNVYGGWIRTLHIKDRKLHGTTVPLGTGDANFPAFFSALAKLQYQGPVVLQAARHGEEQQAVAGYMDFVRSYLDGSTA